MRSGHRRQWQADDHVDWLVVVALALIVGCAVGGGMLASRSNARLRRVTVTVASPVGASTGIPSARVDWATHEATIPVPATVQVGDQLRLWITAADIPTHPAGVARDTATGGFLALETVAVAVTARKSCSVRRQRRLAAHRAADEQATWREIIAHLHDIDA